MRRVLGLWTAVACGELILVLAAGSGGLRLAEPGSWSPWLATHPPEVAVFAVLRLVGLVAGGYLLAVLGVGTALRLCRLDLLVRAADRLTPSSLRAVLDRVATAAVVSATVTVGTVMPVAAAEGPPITLRGLAGPTRSPEPTTTTTVVAPPVASVGGEPLVPTEAVTPGPIEADAPVEPKAGPPPVVAPPSPPRVIYEPAPAPLEGRTWTVRRGDHFWSIAQRVLAEARGQPVPTAEVAPYWQALVAENRSRLADPDNPDLLFAGQVLTVPEVT